MSLILDGSGTITGATTMASTIASPVLTTPALGTPSAIVLTNATAIPYTGFKNRIINGAMGFWQRGTSFTGITNAPIYGADRWVGFVGAAVAGEQLVRSSSVPTGTGFLYSSAFGRTAANTNTNSIWFNQLIESVNMQDLAGQAVTLSFWAKTGTNYSGGTMTVRVSSGTSADESINTYSGGPASGYTGWVAVIGTTQSLTATWTQYSFTGTVGSTALELAVSFAYTPTGTAGADDNIYITGVQLEKGSTATSFDHRPYGTELALCQRYYEMSYNQGVTPGTVTAVGNVWNYLTVSSGTVGDLGTTLHFKVDKRATPTMVFYSPSTGAAGYFQSVTGNTTALSYGAGQHSCAVYGSVNNSNGQLLVHYTATAEL